MRATVLLPAPDRPVNQSVKPSTICLSSLCVVFAVFYHSTAQNAKQWT